MKNRVTKEHIVKIAQEYGRGKSAEEMSLELGLPRPTIMAYASRLRKLGVKIPKNHNKSGRIETAIESLKETNPELF